MGIRLLGPRRRIGQVNNSKVGEKEVKVSILKEKNKEINTINSGMDSELKSGKE